MLHGDIVLKFFELGPVGGRGGVVRNMLLVHDVKFKESKVPAFENWQAEKQRLISSGENPLGTLPVLYIDEKPYFGHIPIARYLAAKVSHCTPWICMTRDTVQFDAVHSDHEVRYRSDVILDEYTNWRGDWAKSNFDEGKKQEYLEKREKLYALMEKLYENRSDQSTPYFMGLETPGVDDVAIYTLLYDDQTIYGKLDMTSYPTLEELLKKVGEIPRIAEWTQEVASRPKPFT